MIVADQSFRTLLNLHPHQHWIVSDGAFAMDGSFYPLPRMQKKVREQLTRVLQRKVLNGLVRQGKLSAEERRRMLRWRHTGFSIDTSVCIREDRRQELEKLLCYIRRHPFRLSGFSYNHQHGVVLYHAPNLPCPVPGLMILAYSGSNLQITGQEVAVERKRKPLSPKR